MGSEMCIRDRSHTEAAVEAVHWVLVAVEEDVAALQMGYVSLLAVRHITWRKNSKRSSKPSRNSFSKSPDTSSV